jgi:hypothetical protein
MSHNRLVKIIVSAVILVFLAGMCYYISMCVDYYRIREEVAARGHVLSRQEWPKTFIDLLTDAERSHISVSDICV